MFAPTRIRGRFRGAVRMTPLAFSVVAAGCEPPLVEAPVTDEAVELWTHPDSIGYPIAGPLDLKAASRSEVWGLDRYFSSVFRFGPSVAAYGHFGIQDTPPSEVANPVRLAVTESSGVVVFDDSTGMVDFYTPSGQHIRGFDPGFRPAFIEVAHEKLRLTFGHTAVDDEGWPRLVVIQTDFMGAKPDTLLAEHVGPEALRSVYAAGGSLTVSPSLSGLWVLARDVPDTVFEVTSSIPARKIVLPEFDVLRGGVIADVQEQIVWLLSPHPAGGVDYEAFDVSRGQEVIDGSEAYLGARTTPDGFTPKVAREGLVLGWWNFDGDRVVPRAYNMRLDDLRANASDARAQRDKRRGAIAAQWEVIRQQASEPREPGAGPGVENPPDP